MESSDMTAPAPAPATDAASAPCLLEARNVSKYFGSVNALQNISLKVNTGEVTCASISPGRSELIPVIRAAEITVPAMSCAGDRGVSKVPDP